MERQAEDPDAEVNGIAGQMSFRPAPIAVFDDEPGISGQDEIARVLGEELKFALLEQRRQRCHTGGPDLPARPACGFKRGVGRLPSLSLWRGGGNSGEATARLSQSFLQWG